MGAGVAWQHDHYPPKSVKAGGPTASSTRAELAATLLALRQANPAEALILLVDSTAAIRRLARFRSQEFRPTWETCKDADIVRGILDQLLLRTEHQGTTTFVLVHGHSSHPLHERADVLAVQGTAESEDGRPQTRYVHGTVLIAGERSTYPTGLRSQDLLGLGRALLDLMSDTRAPPRLHQVPEQTYHNSSTLRLFGTRY